MEIELRSAEIKRILAKEISARLNDTRINEEDIEFINDDMYSDRIRAIIRLEEASV